VLLGRSLQPQACVTHVCAMQQACVDACETQGNLQITHSVTRVDILSSTIYAHVDVPKYAIVYAHVNFSNWIKVAHLESAH
jgi:hypothetical protein